MQRKAPQQQRWTGAVAPEVLVRLTAALDRAGFPAVPAHRIPGGATMRHLIAEDERGPRSAQVEWRAAKAMPGYDEAFALLDTIVRQLSGDAVDRVPGGQPPVVTRTG